ncbi:MAG: Trk system potassium transporter TrkA [Oscillospiraceae bacterium]|nr:Trk system potassium transporter TrkA [Oscillospiraceae bacterium]
MNIIIAGAGEVGYAVAKDLAGEGHNVTLIDQDRARLERSMNAIDVIGYCGNSANLNVLEEAEIHTADVFIAATSGDEINLVSCQFAKKLGAKHTMARIRNPEYIGRIDTMREIMDLTLALNPDQVAAEEIARVLQFPTASRIERFPDSEFEIVTVRIPAESHLHQLSLQDMDRKSSSRVLVCAVERDNTVTIPKGSFVLQAGDLVSLTGTPRDLRRFFTSAGAYKRPVRNVMLLGGSRIAVYLTRLLEKTEVSVTIIEQKPQRAAYLAEILRGADILCADGTDTSVLKEAGLSQADGFVALTGSDEDNIILSMFADQAGVEKVICKVNDDKFTGLMGSAFQDTTVSPKELMAQRIVGCIRALDQSGQDSTMEALYYLLDGRVVATEFVAGPEARCVGKPLKDLRLRPNVLLPLVIHDKQSSIPNGRTVICPGDKVVVITTNRDIGMLDEILLDQGG